MSREMLEYDRDSLRDVVAFLHRQIANLEDELRVAADELVVKLGRLAEA